MKKEIRVLGIDDAPFDKFSDKVVKVIGCIFRGGNFLDGVMSCTVEVDGEDATLRLVEMINKSKFKTQLKAILLDGIAVGGFNVINIKRLHEGTGIPVIVVIRVFPDIEKIKTALDNLGMAHKIQLLDIAGEPIKYKDIYYQNIGISKDDAEEILKITSTHSFIPEPIRVAHLIGAGLVFGESKGRA